MDLAPLQQRDHAPNDQLHQLYSVAPLVIYNRHNGLNIYWSDNNVYGRYLQCKASDFIIPNTIAKQLTSPAPKDNHIHPLRETGRKEERERGILGGRETGRKRGGRGRERREIGGRRGGGRGVSWEGEGGEERRGEGREGRRGGGEGRRGGGRGGGEGGNNSTLTVPPLPLLQAGNGHHAGRTCPSLAQTWGCLWVAHPSLLWKIPPSHLPTCREMASLLRLTAYKCLLHTTRHTQISILIHI